MAQQVPVDPHAQAGETTHSGLHELTDDLAYQRLAIVNVVFVGRPGAADREWVMIDAGVTGTRSLIEKAVAERFGKESRPASILLTHGHFDHVGALEELSDMWQSPIYAHLKELPFLDGRSSYPAPDPSVGGGLMSSLSRFFPRGPVDVARRLHALPTDGTIPGMPGWTWLPTPGHSPGHVSFWRASDRSLIAGDAFITTAQESAFAVATQRPEIHGPPMYYTPDWESARTSVERLAELEPELVVTGHGPAMRGPEMRMALHTLAKEFDRIAVPAHGRYVEHPVQMY
jgi:glyoxylase-like metal-dependent hydrolase (beta-lactamase superfamily II)